MADINKIRLELSKMNCRVHIRTADISKVGTELFFKTCCDDFKTKLSVRYEQMLQEEPVKKKIIR